MTRRPTADTGPTPNEAAADDIVDDPPTPFPDYAADLVGRASRSFWWD
ncbi:hypothetical protein [Streptomyces sp. NPDC094468]